MLSRHKNIIYNLKRRWGRRIILYIPLTNTPNFKTGELVREYTRLPINRAILMTDRKAQAERIFDVRIVLIDKKDAPTLNETCHIEFMNARYEIEQIDNTSDAAYSLLVKHVEADPETILPIAQSVAFSHAKTGVKL